MTAGDNRRHETDPLMAVITGEPLSEEQRTDPAFMAEHRAATADVQLLREQLGRIADALTQPVETSGPVLVRPPRPRPRPRALSLSFGVLAVVAVAAVLSGLAWLLAQAGNGISSSAGGSAAKQDSGSSSGGYGAMSPSTACARLVVEGDVTAVEPVPGGGVDGQYRVTLHVTRYYRPARGEAEVVLLTDETADPRPRRGQHVLLGIRQHAATPDLWVVGTQQIADQRAVIRRELARSPTAAPTCSAP